jgi:hypothetical protein
MNMTITGNVGCDGFRAGVLIRSRELPPRDLRENAHRTLLMSLYTA